MDWSTIGQLIGQAAPTLGGLLGGLIPFPGGAVLGQVAGKVLAEALGVPPTPEAVGNAIQTQPPEQVAAAVSAAEAKINAELERHKADLADIQDARKTALEYVRAGSPLAWGAVAVSAIVMIGFIALSILALKPDAAGVNKDVTLYLLGAWQSLAAAAVAYWIGSSAGSAEKTSMLASLTPPPAVAVKKK